MPRRIVRASALLAAGAALAGCAVTNGGTGAASGGGGASVVATTTVWGDVARQVVGCAGQGSVQTLMPVGADPHDFTASSKDVVAMAGADLVITNGLGLEEGLADSLAAAQKDGATVLELAPQLDPVPFGEHAHDHEDGAGHAHDSDDPHVWLDVTRVATAATIIGDRLAEQTGNQDFARCGTEVSDSLKSLNDEVVQILSVVPADRRILVTDHDAFGYFSDAYGFEVAGVVIPGGSTLAQPSSAEMAGLTATVRDAGVPAVFANTANPQALVDALAAEVGRVEVVDLYVGSLGPAGSGADTYQGMMRTNAQRIADALSARTAP